MIATQLGAAYLTETTTHQTMLFGVFTVESYNVVTTVFIIHPFP